MSLNETEKWASEIINELFKESSMSYQKGAQMLNGKGSKSGNVGAALHSFEDRLAKNDLDRDYITGSPRKCANESKHFFLASSNFLSSSFSPSKSVPDVSVVPFTSPSSKSNDSVASLVNEKQDSSDLKGESLDQECKEFDNMNASKKLPSSAAIKFVKDIENNTLLAIESDDASHEFHEKMKIPESNRLDFKESDAVFSEPFERDGQVEYATVQMKKTNMDVETDFYDGFLSNEDLIQLTKIDDNKVKILRLRSGNKDNITKSKGESITTRSITNPDFVSDSDDAVVFQRVVRIIAAYRYLCNFFENFLVRPCATFIAEVIDLVTFVFIMGLCIVYLCGETLRESYFQSSSPSYNVRAIKNTRKKNNRLLINSDRENRDCSRNTTDCYTTEKCKHAEFDKAASDSSTEIKEVNTYTNNLNSVSFIDPKYVIAISGKMEFSTPNLENVYERGENCMEFLPNGKEQHTVTFNIYESNFIEIIRNEDEQDRTDFDTEIVASSNKYENELHEFEDNSSFGIYQCSQNAFKPIKVEEDEEANATSEDLTVSKFPTFSDMDERHILNSTEVDDSDFEARDRRKSIWSDSGALNLGLPSMILKKEFVCSSPLNANPPDFLFRSDRQNESSCSLNEDGDARISDDQGYRKQRDFSKMDYSKARSSVNLNLPSENVRIKDEPRDSPIQKNVFEEFNPENLESQLPKPFPVSAQSGSRHSFESNERGQNYAAGFQDFRETETFQLRTLNSDSEFESLVETAEALTGANSFHKKRSIGNFKQRMSLILNNWKGMQCVSANPRNKKKYKKYTGNMKP